MDSPIYGDSRLTARMVGCDPADVGSIPAYHPKGVDMRIMLKSKIHGIKVTDVNPHYDGSITIDSNLLQRTEIFEYEQVHVLDVTNGKRFVTYAIAGGKDECCVNGAAARLVEFGDELIILAYGIYDYGFFDGSNRPKIIKI